MDQIIEMEELTDQEFEAELKLLDEGTKRKGRLVEETKKN